VSADAIWLKPAAKMATRRAGNKRIYFSGDGGLQENPVGSDYFAFLNIKHFFTFL
jgi:hypothetical protein